MWRRRKTDTKRDWGDKQNVETEKDRHKERLGRQTESRDRQRNTGTERDWGDGLTESRGRLISLGRQTQKVETDREGQTSR